MSCKLDFSVSGHENPEMADIGAQQLAVLNELHWIQDKMKMLTSRIEEYALALEDNKLNLEEQVKMVERFRKINSIREQLNSKAMELNTKYCELCVLHDGLLQALQTDSDVGIGASPDEDGNLDSPNPPSETISDIDMAADNTSEGAMTNDESTHQWHVMINRTGRMMSTPTSECKHFDLKQRRAAYIAWNLLHFKYKAPEEDDPVRNTDNKQSPFGDVASVDNTNRRAGLKDPSDGNTAHALELLDCNKTLFVVDKAFNLTLFEGEGGGESLETHDRGRRDTAGVIEKQSYVWKTAWGKQTVCVVIQVSWKLYYINVRNHLGKVTWLFTISVVLGSHVKDKPPDHSTVWAST